MIQKDDFAIIYHGDTELDLASAKAFELRMGVSLQTHKANDPENNWRCSTAENEEDQLAWFWITTNDRVYWTTTNLNRDFSTSETVSWPRQLTKETIINLVPDDAVKVQTLGDLVMVLDVANPVFAKWTAYNEDKTIMYSLTMTRDEAFTPIQWDFQIYGASHYNEVSELLVGKLEQAVRGSVDDGNPSAYSVFTFDKREYVLVTDNMGYFTIFSYSTLFGLMEVDEDIDDIIFDVADFINEHPQVEFAS